MGIRGRGSVDIQLITRVRVKVKALGAARGYLLGGCEALVAAGDTGDVGNTI